MNKLFAFLMSILLSVASLFGWASKPAEPPEPKTGTIVTIDGENYIVTSNSSAGEYEITLTPSNGSDEIVCTFTEETIEADAIPEYITPTEFESQEEIDAYLALFAYSVQALEATTQANEAGLMQATENVTGSVTVPKTATMKTVEICSKTIGLVSWVRFGITYSTSSGKFTYAQPYTNHTGMTLGSDWSQASSGYSFNSAKTKVNVQATGTVDMYLLIKSLFKIFSYQVNFTGSATVA